MQAERVGEGWDREQLLQQVNHWRCVYNGMKPSAAGGKLTCSSAAQVENETEELLHLSCSANTRRAAKHLLCMILMSESCYLIRGCSAEASLTSDCVRSANGARGLISFWFSWKRQGCSEASSCCCLLTSLATAGASAFLRLLRLKVSLLPVSGLALWSPQVLVLRAVLCMRTLRLC